MCKMEFENLKNKKQHKITKNSKGNVQEYNEARKEMKGICRRKKRQYNEKNVERDTVKKSKTKIKSRFK